MCHSANRSLIIHRCEFEYNTKTHNKKQTLKATLNSGKQEFYTIQTVPFSRDTLIDKKPNKSGVIVPLKAYGQFVHPQSGFSCELSLGVRQ